MRGCGGLLAPLPVPLPAAWARAIEAGNRPRSRIRALSIVAAFAELLQPLGKGPIGDRLVIGKFCAIARGAKFIMNGANHKVSGISTYPFYIFGNGWEKVMPQPGDLPYKGDTVIGNDVWIGYDCLIMPGVKIGNGAIISSRSVVVSDVPPYTVVGGNPAKVIKERFPADVVQALEEIAWWDWPIEKISRHLAVIVSADVEALRACVRS